MTSASMLSGAEGYDEDVFEIEDFTIVTIKEGLCAELEQLLRKWELTGDNGNSYSFTKSALAECQWDSKYEKITFGNNHLIVTYYWPKNLQRIEQETEANVIGADASDSFLTNASRLFCTSETDFCPGSIICNQFGVVEFILLTPSDWHSDKVSNEDQLRGLLSCITESAGKAGCALPIFVQYGERERQLYFGVCQNNSMRTNFESVHQRRGHPLKCHLSGCLDIFRETLQSSLMDEANLRISMQFDYVLQDKPCYEFPKNNIIEEEMLPTENASIIDISHLPFGATRDAIEEFGLSAIWTNIERGIAVEEQNLSNLDPQRALAWSAWVSIHKDASYLMSFCLRKLLEIAQSEEGSSSVLQQRVYWKQDASRALSSLLSPTVPENISIGSMETSENCFEPDIIGQWVDKVFGRTKREDILPSSNTSCDGDVESSCWMGEGSSSGPGGAVKSVQKSKACPTESINGDGKAVDIYQKLCDILATCKSAPESSLTCYISVALAQMLCSQNYSPTGFSDLWSTITHELQGYYEKNLYIPGLDECLDPDLSMCKFHQNLQLLQCAVKAKKRRESKNFFIEESQSCKSEEDEFFDASESLEKNDEMSRESNSSKAEGRLKPCGTLRLFHFSDRLIYEPVTQSRVPMTEDMLEKHAEYLASLKDPDERVRAQLEPLFSDMEAFKAANPGCCFEDFVRWHSPRDFIVNDENTGHLSSRMTGEDNTWQQTWNQAQPKPACRQKMLFDDLKAANKIISDFENLTMSGLIFYIIPVLFKCATMQLVDESKLYFTVIGDKLLNLCKKVLDCTKSNDLEDYLDAVKDMAQLEGLVTCCNVLYTQLVSAVDKKLTEDENCEIRQFAMSLVLSNEQNCGNVIDGGKAGAGYRVAIVRGLCGPVGSALKNLFFGSDVKSANRAEKRTLEQILTGDEDMPYRRRQYVMRCGARRPTLGSRTLPQRLYAAISKEEYRLCLALSSDTVLS